MIDEALYKISKWDSRFMEIARKTASWSKDPRLGVGAVIVKDRRILSTGYNGFPAGFPDIYDGVAGETKNTYTVHAEANAVANLRGSASGATIYVAGMHPCAQCAGLIVQAGIKRVVYDYMPVPGGKWQDSINAARRIFTSCGVATVCTMPQIILIGGKKSSGKTWVAEQLGLRHYAFADIPKDMFYDIFGVEFDDVKRTNVPAYGGRTARQFMQAFATDAAQAYLGPTVWRDALVHQLELLKRNNVNHVVISDWRFPHEDIPGALKVYINGGDPDPHISENAIGPQHADIVANDSNEALEILRKFLDTGTINHTVL